MRTDVYDVVRGDIDRETAVSVSQDIAETSTPVSAGNFVHRSGDTMGGQLSFDTGIAQPPLVLSVNEQGQTVVGFDADTVDGVHGSALLTNDADQTIPWAWTFKILAVNDPDDSFGMGAPGGVFGGLVPTMDNAFDLGSASYRWQDAYAARVYTGRVDADTVVVGSGGLSLTAGSSSTLPGTVSFPDGLSATNVSVDGITMTGAGVGALIAGLNADQLDGNHAAAFALSGHTHAEADITDGSILARVAADETISGAWTFSKASAIGLMTAYNTQVVFGGASAIGSYVMVNLTANTSTWGNSATCLYAVMNNSNQGAANGITTQCRLSSTTNGHHAYGGTFYGRMYITGGGTYSSSTINGGYFLADVLTPGAATIGVARGGYFRVNCGVTGNTFTTAVGGRFELEAATGATITNGYGVQVPTPAAGGTYTNGTGVYIGDMTRFTSSANAINVAAATITTGALMQNIFMDGGNWNNGHLRLENGHIWNDATNNVIRFKGSAPTGETDGFSQFDAAVALGGGAAPTLGTIGGTGPATAAQAGWLAMFSGATRVFVPYWV